MSSVPSQSNSADADEVPAAHVAMDEGDAVLPPKPSLDDPEATNRLSATIIVAVVLALLLCVALVLIAYQGR